MQVLFVYAAQAEAAGLEPWLVRAVQLGVGKGPAAMRMTQALVLQRPQAVVLFGVAGAYNREALPIGGLCLVEEEVWGDEGADETHGFVDLASMGFGSREPYVAQPDLLQWVRTTLGPLPRVRGATVSTCSANDSRSALVQARTGAQVESMEGAAVAMCCHQWGVPWVQLRAISNFTGNRSLAQWDFTRAQSRLQDAVAKLCRASPH